ncbi:MAG TPA: hypothetical protein VEJ44_00900 [Acidimicrobiales bacterium]|nr:hypothetical protein [Acidimicrobiales bacterium]
MTFAFDGGRGDVWLAGCLDAYSLVALQAGVDQFWVEPFDEVVVHLRDLMEVDSSGLDELFRLRTLVEDRGARFRMDGSTQPVTARLRPRSAAQRGAPAGRS